MSTPQDCTGPEGCRAGGPMPTAQPTTDLAVNNPERPTGTGSPLGSEGPAQGTPTDNEGTQAIMTSITRPQNAAYTSATHLASPSVAAAATSSSSGSNLGTGAVAGIAVATLIIGAALAFLAAFFLFKKRDKNQNANVGSQGYSNYSDSTPELVMMQKSVGRNSPYVQVSQTPAPAPMPAPAPVPVRQIDPVAAILPPAAHDNDIQMRATALFTQIQRHVETYYRDVQASITPSMEPELARFGAKEVNMAELLQDCANPTTAIKHALAAYVLGITGPRKDNNGEQTMFPDHLDSAALIHGSNTAGTDPNLNKASTLHRRLSVYLFTTTNPQLSRSVASSIREAAEHFGLTFFPWASPVADDDAREDDLARIIAEALDCRIWLFGQPGEFAYRWDGVGMRGVVVCPELVRKGGMEGDGANASAGGERERVMVEGKVVSL